MYVGSVKSKFLHFGVLYLANNYSIFSLLCFFQIISTFIFHPGFVTFLINYLVLIINNNIYWHAAAHGVAKSWTQLSDQITTIHK